MSGVKRTRNSSELGPRKHDRKKKKFHRMQIGGLGLRLWKRKHQKRFIMIQREDECRRRVNGIFIGRIWKPIINVAAAAAVAVMLMYSIVQPPTLRRGHRSMRLDGSARMKSQVRTVQPVTELILHPDAIESYEKLSPFARSNIEENIDEAERFQQFVDILTPENDEEEKNEGLYICLYF